MEITKVVIIATMGAVGGGGIVWLLMTLRRQAEQITELKQRQESGPAWATAMKLDHRAQLASIAVLQELAAHDQLDALMRLSPEAVHRVVEQIAPHLFTRENIK
jgi:hypothetical protein